MRFLLLPLKRRSHLLEGGFSLEANLRHFLWDELNFNSTREMPPGQLARWVPRTDDWL